MKCESLTQYRIKHAKLACYWIRYAAVFIGSKTRGPGTKLLGAAPGLCLEPRLAQKTINVVTLAQFELWSTFGDWCFCQDAQDIFKLNILHICTFRSTEFVLVVLQEVNSHAVLMKVFNNTWNKVNFKTKILIACAIREPHNSKTYKPMTATN